MWALALDIFNGWGWNYLWYSQGKVVRRKILRFIMDEFLWSVNIARRLLSTLIFIGI